MTEVRRNAKGLLQKQPVSTRGFNKSRRARFLDVLAATCNVKAAAGAAGIAHATAYGLRRRDGGFAQLWAEAIDQGQERLAEELTARALGQVPDGDNPDGDRDPGAVPAFDAELALKILQVRARIAPAGQRRVASGPGPSIHALHEALARRLDEAEARIARRVAAGEATSSAATALPSPSPTSDIAPR